MVYLARNGTEVSAVESQDALVVDHRFEGSRGSCELLGLHPLFDNLSRNTNKAGGLFRQGRIRNGFIRVFLAVATAQTFRFVTWLPSSLHIQFVLQETLFNGKISLVALGVTLSA